MNKCPYCQINFDTSIVKINKANHMRWCQNNPNRKQRKTKICLGCGEIHSSRGKYCNKTCYHDNFHMNEETKLKLSNSRKSFLLANPDKHPWKNNSKFISVPCEFVKEYLISKNMNFVAEWKPLEDRFFSIDIAFPDIKVGIEINGNQHYNSDGSLKEYYQLRHDLIEAAGWKLIELHYLSCFNINILDSAVNLYKQPDYSEYFIFNKNKVKQDTLPLGQKARLKSDLKWEKYKELVLNSGIDFYKFGWVQEVAKILNISSQKVNGWMKRYLPDFYETECFKRKSIS